MAGENFSARTKCLPAEVLDVLQQSSLSLEGPHLPRVQHSRASLFAKKGLMHSPAFKRRTDTPITAASWNSFRKITFSLPEQAASCQSPLTASDTRIRQAAHSAQQTPLYRRG